MQKLVKKDIEDIFSLTPMQEGMLFYYLQDQEDNLHIEQLSLVISGEIDIETLKKAWNVVIRTNEMLRTVFRWEKVERPVQIVLKEHQPDIEYYDFSRQGLDTGEKKRQIEALRRSDRCRGFHLTDVPFRVTVCKLEDGGYEMVITHHHILYDGWSNGIILKEFFYVYNRLYNGKELKKAIKTKFAEFIRWIRQRDTTDDENYWKGYLEGFKCRKQSPVNSKKKAGTEDIENYQMKFREDEKKRLERFAKSWKITLSALVYCAWGLLLQQYHNFRDVIFDTTVSGRSAKIKGIEDIVGMFINTLPVRVKSLPGEKIIHLLRRTARELNEREKYENTSRMSLKEGSEIEGNARFESVLIFENYPLDMGVIKESETDNNALAVRSFSFNGRSNYELTVIITIFNEINFSFSYDKRLFRQQEIIRLVEHFTGILESILSEPGKKVYDLKIVSEEERSNFFNELKNRRRRLGEDVEARYVPPQNKVEEKLVEIWSEVLGVDSGRIGIDGNFFHFRGHSLKAAVLTSGIHKEFNVKISLADIFKNPTIRKLAVITAKAGKEGFVDIEKIEEKDFYELSFNQRRLWVIHQMEPHSSAYNMPNRIVLGHAVDRSAVKRVLHKIVKRHESLRTGFVTINDEPSQYVKGEVEIPFREIDISSMNKKEKQQERERIFAGEAAAPFDLIHVPLFRFVLVKVDDEWYDFIFIMHHIISDGWSLGIIKDEFYRLYEGERAGKGVGLRPAVFQYKDFSAWHNKRIKDPVFKEKSHRFWLEKMEGGFPVINLPKDYNRGNNISESAGYRCTVPKELTDKLSMVAEDNNVTLFIVMFSIFNILLSRFSSQEEVVCGAASAGREHIALQDIVGFFVNTLVVKTHINEEEKWGDFSQRLAEDIQRMLLHQGYPLELVSSERGMRFPPLSVFFNMLNLDRTGVKNRLDFVGCGHMEKVEDVKFDLVLYISEYLDGIEIQGHYKKAFFKPETIEYMVQEYLKLLGMIAEDPAKRIKEYKAPGESPLRLKYELSRKEKEISGDFVEFKKEDIDRSIASRFEQQVQKYADNIVVKTPGKIMTYRELNCISNQVARGICRLYGEGIECGVALLFEHGADMIPGILGTLKAGKYYIPLDPAYPVERLVYMLRDSNANIVLTNSKNRPFAEKLINKTAPSLELIDIDSIDPGLSKKNPGIKIKPGNLAYILYTSGSTGKSKGVVQNQRNVLHFTRVYTNGLHINPKDRLTLFSSYSFDAAVMDIFGAVLNGAALFPFDVRKEDNLYRLSNFLHREKITIYHSIPTLYRCFTDSFTGSERFPHLRFIVLGGETVYNRDVERYKKYFPGKCLFINGLGPTESTVTLQFYINKRMELTKGSVPVGFPVDETEVFLLDDKEGEVPVYGIGEIVYKSEYLALGYVNQPGKTAAVFGKNPLTGKDRVFRTGDLGKRLLDGNIEYAGRKDFQVKIKGYRIELGEIESQLLKLEEVTGAAVAANESKSRDKYICAYIVSDKEISTPRLRGYLAGMLPSYMIPSHFVRLKEFPLTSSGKVDRKSLPDPEGITSGNVVDYRPPKNTVEKKLVEICREVLGRPGVSLDEDFFMIGGDSIKAIRIAAQMKKQGYKIEVKDIFQFPSISQLAPLVKKMERVAEQSLVREEIPLTPIQKWFFSSEIRGCRHYNQSVMLHWEERLEKEAVKAMLLKIQEHHDALRMAFKQEKGKMIQTNIGPGYPISLQVFDLRNREKVNETIEAAARRTRESIDPETGPLMKWVLFHTDEGDRLFITIHRLVIDAVSWRIFIEDIETLYRQYKKGEPFSLPSKTDSFKLWSETLSAYANHELFLNEKAYWMELESQVVEPIKRDYEDGDNYTKDMDILSFSLSREETRLVLGEVNEAFGTEVNEILLTALGLAIKKSFGNEKILIAVEGDAREGILPGVDVRRTVGRFTGVYPVLLDFSHKSRGKELSHRIKEIKETLRRVPNKGIGYGILKYITAEKYRREMDFKLNPRIRCDYLGQYDNDAPPGRIAFIGLEPYTGNPGFNVSTVVEKQRLTMSISFSRKQYRLQTVEGLMNTLERELKRVISYCVNRDKKEFTPADFTYRGLSMETVDRIASQYNLEDIYTLTPMQEGMLFHALYNKSSPVYFVQISFRLRGQLDIPLLEKSLNLLFKRHDILRTAFIYEGVDRPVQLVLKERKIDFFYRDIRGLADEVKKNEFIEEYKKNNRKRLFDLARDVLMRVAVIRVDEAHYVLIRSTHHILMDGWCRAVLNSEFFEIYRGYVLNRPWQLPPVRPYRIYIEWLEQQDREKSKTYWRHFLEDYNEAVSIPKKKAAAGDLREYKRQEYTFIVEKEKTGALSQVAAENNVTLSIIMQAVWGILLANYNNKHDVVFGIVVSGRPAEIAGVESMVGLFINTIPVRIRYRKETRFHQLVRQLQKESLESEPHQYSSLAEIQAESALKQHLIDHFLTFLNFPVEEFAINKTDGIINLGEELGLEISDIESLERSNYNFDVLIDFREELTIKLRYNTNIYDSNFMKKRLASHIREVIHQVTDDSTIRIEDIVISHDRLAANPNMPGDDGGDFDL